MTRTMNALTRRDTLKALACGVALVGTTGAFASRLVRAAPTGKLAVLTARLAAAPRRRSFDTVPLIVKDPQYWDHEAAAALLAYDYRPVQAWDNADLNGAWPGLMRESINGQVFAHHHTDFLAVGAMHGGAHLALFEQVLWDKYKLAHLTSGKFTSNTLIVEAPGRSLSDPLEKPDGFYGPANNNIVSLQKRGAVFVACHDSIHAIAREIQETTPGETADRIAADLTNHLIPGAVLVPSVVAFLGQLAQAGYSYVKT